MRDMKKTSDMADELRPEYDVTQLMKGAMRGKYAARYGTGTNLVLLEPDVAAAFPDAKAVNAALRLVIRLSRIAGGSKEQQARE
jgi:hypothetical protein